MPISPDPAKAGARAMPGFGRDPASVRRRIETMEEVLEKAPCNWYLEANEAKARGLIQAVL